MPFIAIFIILPFLELMVFAAVSGKIGLLTSLTLAFLTAVIGGALVKHQGLQTIAAMRKSMQRGGLPLNHLFDGFCLIAAGVMLITPGFITDTLGFLLLIPAVRNALRGLIKNHTDWGAAASETRTSNLHIIEGEFEHLDD